MIDRSKFLAPVALMTALSFAACAGEATDGGDGDGDTGGDGDGDTGGDGDGDTGGDGDGDITVCTDNYVYGLSATVIGGGVDPGQNDLIGPASGGSDGGGGTSGGGGSGAPLPDAPCYATVVAVDGDYMETLECYSTGTDCQCYGAGERAGSYTVTATLGDMVEEEMALVTADECHVKGVQIIFFD